MPPPTWSWSKASRTRSSWTRPSRATAPTPDPAGPEPRLGLGLTLTAAVLFGAAAPLSSLLLGDVGPVPLAGVLYLGAALAVAPLGLRRSGVPSTAGERRRLAVAVVAGGGIAPVLLLTGLERTPASVASLLLTLELVFTAVLARVLLREHLGRRAVLGLGLVTAGAIVASGAAWSTAGWSALLVVGATLAWAVDNTATASLDRLPPARITLVKGVVAGTVNLILGLAIGQSLPGTGGLAAGLAIGAVCYGVSITLWIGGARRLGAARAGTAFAVAPFFGALLSWPITGDPLTPGQWVAMALAGAGVALAVRDTHAHRHLHAPLLHDHAHAHPDAHHEHPHADVPPAPAHHHPHGHDPVAHEHEHLPDRHHRHDH